MASLITPTSPNSLAPTQRLTSEQRLANFTAQADSIYNKLSPYDGSTGGLGFSQPFVYTRLTDSKVSKNLTKYDNQAFPIGSTVRDLERVGKFMASGHGLLFIGKQYLLQKQNAFNETGIYNPLSVLGATAQPATVGLMNRPKRYVDSGGSILGTFINALKGSVGISTGEPTIAGTATGDSNGASGTGPFSNYAAAHGGTKAGVLRFDTAASAISKFSGIWTTTTNNPTNGGFLSSLRTTFANIIPSTNPRGDGYGKGGLQWAFRPEYPNGQTGIYYTFLTDAKRMFTVEVTPTNRLYNVKGDASAPTQTISYFHRYYPATKNGDEATGMKYATNTNIVNTKNKTGQNMIGVDGGIQTIYDKMVAAIGAKTEDANQLLASAEMYTNVSDENPTKTTYRNYKQIPSAIGGNSKFYTGLVLRGVDTQEAKKFAQSSGSFNGHDRYNAQTPISGNGVSRTNIPASLKSLDPGQSADVIFFYFFDLINNVYVPFRATISGLSEQNSAEWEDISYLGRADKMFVYKGFTRDINLAFSVYANSIKELVPMWKRINYLVGLTRPSKYTGKAIVTSSDTNAETSGRESQFIYPPMVTLRLGDLYYDQPCVISSISVNIPDDTNWESYRGDDYEYVAGPDKTISVKGAKSRQLPLKADISVTLKLLEKTQAITSAENRFGYNSPL